MSKIALVTDSTSDLPKKVAEKQGIFVVPLNLHFGDETFIDGIDITSSEFYPKLIDSDFHPSTSQPSVGKFIKTYEEILQSYDSIISIHMSSKLSATHSSAVQAKEQISNDNIRIIDSKNGTLGLGSLVYSVSKLMKKENNLDNLVTETESLVDKSQFYGLCATLEYLAKGGRIGKAQEFVGSLLKLKPILSTRGFDGEIGSVAKVRTFSKGMDYLVNIVENNKIEDLFVVHGGNFESAEKLIEKLEKVIDKKKIIVSEFGPVVGTHLGPGSFGIGFVGSE